MSLKVAPCELFNDRVINRQLRHFRAIEINRLFNRHSENELFLNVDVTLIDIDVESHGVIAARTDNLGINRDSDRCRSITARAQGGNRQNTIAYRQEIERQRSRR